MGTASLKVIWCWVHFPYISFGSLHKVKEAKASEGHESSLDWVAIVEQGQVEDTNT